MTHLPATRREMEQRGWGGLDVILVTGDAHVDHPSFPAAILGRALEADGWRVGVISRPDVQDPESVAVFGPPRLFWGVTAGALDSMLANFTALRKRRSDDPYAPAGRGGGRPDRAVAVYVNLIRRKYGRDAFVVAGGLEASLRRFAHYDYWSDSVRRPILLDCGAQILVHGMGEGPVLEIARRIAAAGGPSLVRPEDFSDIPGVAWKAPRSAKPPEEAVGLPSAEDVASNPEKHVLAFRLQEEHPQERMWQDAGGMRVIANPRWIPDTAELDRLYGLPFTREAHPMYGGAEIPALEAVRFSITTHRGCFGGCSFCAIGAHQGKTVTSRSLDSILAEARWLAWQPWFRGTISDVGGPTANMYGMRCRKSTPCARPSCLWPAVCPALKTDASAYKQVLRMVSEVEGVRHVFVSSGIRMDLALLDDELARLLALRHTSGHLKVAPEHVSADVLRLMRKPAGNHFEAFLRKHREFSHAAGRRQRVLPYLMAAHPGCRLEHMFELMRFMEREGLIVEQCQIFTPLPGTASAAMYATGLDPWTMEPVFVEKTDRGKRMQKACILRHLPESRRLLREARSLLRKRRDSGSEID